MKRKKRTSKAEMFRTIIAGMSFTMQLGMLLHLLGVSKMIGTIIVVTLAAIGFIVLIVVNINEALKGDQHDK